MRIAFATHAGLPDLTPSDRLAADELSRRGAAVTPLPWSAAHDWREFDAVVIRATWDYYTRPDDFQGWLRRLDEQRVALWNPAPLALWNMHKGYLRDLGRAGARIVPTAWISPTDSPGSLEQLARTRDWTDVVVKPVVSASANRTWRTHGLIGETDETAFRALAASGEVMVQPLIESVVRDGEWSLVFLGGEFSHAVLKRPASGDFRVQGHHGGTVGRAEPAAEWIEEARLILELVHEPWLYARVDGCIVDGRFLLMELEMLEPDLFFSFESTAPARFAAAILESLGSRV